MEGLRRAAILIAVTLYAGHAFAQSDDALQRARTHFEAGRALYQLGNFTEAIREFAAGYQLAPRPQFLLNLGQCYRKLGQLDKTRDMYERFVRDVAPNDPERGPAQLELREIERQLAANPHAVTASPATASTSPAPDPESTHPTETSSAALVATPAAASLTASAPSRKPWIKRHWWIIPVGVVVAGAAVGLGVYFGTRSPSACQSGDLACLDFSQVKP